MEPTKRLDDIDRRIEGLQVTAQLLLADIQASNEKADRALEATQKASEILANFMKFANDVLINHEARLRRLEGDQA